MTYRSLTGLSIAALAFGAILCILEISRGSSNLQTTGFILHFVGIGILAGWTSMVIKGLEERLAAVEQRNQPPA